MHEGVEIERGVERVGEGVKELDLVDGSDTDIRSLQGLIGGRPVVSLKAMFGCDLCVWRGGGGSAS
jgi:hypothetical protein